MTGTGNRYIITGDIFCNESPVDVGLPGVAALSCVRDAGVDGDTLIVWASSSCRSQWW